MRATTHPDNDKTIAKKVGVSPSTIGRWWSGEIDPKPRQVVALAKAYGASPLGALVNAGYVSAEDLDLTITMATDLDAVSTYALLDEIQRRMELMNDFTGWATAIGEGNGSPAVLGEGQLRYVRPGVAPVDVNTEALVDAFDGHVVPLEMYNDEQMYGVVEPTEDGNVRGRQEDYGLVSNESIEEFPGTDDTDYDNA
jgi:transcriptional regulator with XRE-family HTH domain